MSSTTDRLGDMGVFQLVEQPDGRVALLADNKKFLALDTVSLRLVARADSVMPECLFRIEQHRRWITQRSPNVPVRYRPPERRYAIGTTPEGWWRAIAALHVVTCCTGHPVV
ncbi:MAG: hypothetical protein IPG74_03450 [Flavobacteriales bacterium]|nr:hypothetical protein [Flavobacteriales bacterium]